MAIRYEETRIGNNAIIVWLDNKNKVLGWRKAKPFELYLNSRKPFMKVLEVPFSEKNREIIAFFVGK